MKILKRIFIVLFVLVILVAITGFFLPSSVYVVRSITIKKSQLEVFNYLNSFENMPAWSPWHALDPQMEIKYDGPSNGVGASYAWKSNVKEVGYGKQIIILSISPSKIESELFFANEPATITGFDIIAQTPTTTDLSWYITFDFGENPFARWFGLKMEDFIAADFEKGLSNIRANLEN